MSYPTEVFGDVAVVHAPDELAGESSAPLAAYAAALAQRRVVLDLDHVELVDSGGLGVLLDLHDALRQTGGELRVAVTNSVNRKILEITRLDEQLDVFSTVIDAVKSFR